MKYTALLIMSRARRLSVLEALEACRIPVLLACDLKEAVGVLSRQPVEVVLADAQLPDGTFADVLESVARLGCPSQVIVCVDRVNERLCSEAYRLGAYDLLTEPYMKEELLRILEAAAAKSYMRRLGLPGSEIAASAPGIS